MHSGSLTYEDYKNLFLSKFILTQNFNTKQLQPSSIDLTLSSECYEIKSSFLSSNDKVKNKLNKFITVCDPYLDIKNKTFNKKIKILNKVSNKLLF